MNKISASVLIIAQNSEISLRRCLDSLKDFQEVVFVDGGSTDNTLKIASEYENVVVYQNAWPGFVAQRNFSIDKATHDWCIMIDSDEAFTPELVAEVRNVIAVKNPKKLYRIIRTEYFEGIPIEYGRGSSEYQERLFQKNHIRYTGGVHHGHLIDGRFAKVGDPEMADLAPHLRILHWPSYDFEDWIKKVPRFILLIGQEKIKKGKRVGYAEMLITIFLSFFQLYGKSWKNGKIGFSIACREVAYRILLKLYIFNRTHFHKNALKENFEKTYLDK